MKIIRPPSRSVNKHIVPLLGSRQGFLDHEAPRPYHHKYGNFII